MPQLLSPDTRQIKRVILKRSSTEDEEAWVDIYTDQMAGDLLNITGFGKTLEEIDHTKATITGLQQAIADWNFTDAQGNKEEVSEQNIRRLPSADFTQLVQEVFAVYEGQKLDDAKKNN